MGSFETQIYTVRHDGKKVKEVIYKQTGIVVYRDSDNSSDDVNFITNKTVKKLASMIKGSK